jgi:dystonin
MELLEELLQWLIGKESELSRMEAQPLPNDCHSVVHMIDDLQTFIDDLSRREPDIEKIAKVFSSKTPTKGRTKGQVEHEIRNPRARKLMEKWRSVWKRAMDRMKRLQEHLIYCREREGMNNWLFDEWRKRFLDWVDNRKMRILDFFRDLDKLNQGRVPIPEFIDGFLRSGFPTNRPEMERVADIFDINKDGYVDQNEWLTTLKPKTEQEIIEDEIQRQVALCTCPVRYRVNIVGEGMYKVSIQSLFQF